MAPDKAKCLRPACVAPEKARGLCMSCYMMAKRLVDNGTTTWVLLEEAGRALARHRGRHAGIARRAWLQGADGQ